MSQHLFAIAIKNRVYRDDERYAMTDAEFEAIVRGHHLPPHHLAYHYYGQQQWEEVLKLPVVGTGSIREELQSILSTLCRTCWRFPKKSGSAFCSECEDEHETTE